MKKIHLFNLLLVFGFQWVAGQTMEGDWSGELNISGEKLPLVFHLQQKEGIWSGTMDSPKQNVFGIAISAIDAQDTSIRIELSPLRAFFQGTWVSKDSISGVFNQANMELPLTLTRGVTLASAPKRPQEPKKPFPYIEKQVEILNKKDGVVLAGTLTLPRGKGPFPAVVLISGSGPQNRDEELMGHKPFWVIADYLTRHGIAVLRYDDRGVGKSSGNFTTATTADFSTDAEAAFEYLKTVKKIAPGQIGLIGHSEGGMVAQMIAARNESVAKVVLLAAPGVPVDSLMVLQLTAVNNSQQVPEDQTEKMIRNSRNIYQILRANMSKNELQSALRIEFERQLLELADKEQIEMRNQIESTIALYTSNWFLFFINFDPEDYLRSIKCPVLALNGESDIQVTYRENLMGIMNTLLKHGNSTVKVQMFPKLNHLFQECTTCTVAEYGELEETFSTDVLEEMKRFLLNE